MVDLADEINDGKVCYQQFGRKEPFDRGRNSSEPILRRPRWFKFGNLNNTLEVGIQIDLLDEIIGKRLPSNYNDDDPSIPVFAAKRRKKQYIYFYKGNEEECTTTINCDKL